MNGTQNAKEYLRRFTTAERGAIRAAAVANPVLEMNRQSWDDTVTIK